MTVEEILAAIAQHMRPSLSPNDLGSWLHQLRLRGLAQKTEDRRWTLTTEGHRAFGSSHPPPTASHATINERKP